MQDMLNSLSTYGYIILFFYSLGGGMVAIIAAGLLSYIGKLDLWVCISIAAIANFIGDMILFYLGRYNKSSILPYFKSHKRKLALAQILFKRYGDKIIFIKKYIYGLKTLVPIAIGITKYSINKFIVINAICSVVWAVSLGILSYKAGDFLQKIMNYFGDNTFVIPVMMVSLLVLIWFYFSLATRKAR
ncbi:DedA family protein [Campylobacter hyointestinalis]|uniref:DedA family protein n=1 Tax=Campylobacter hyointestinalis TaxID=198 RepID=UPI000DCBCD83|nr:DedA family protein [Campylobacter hyointestinalis]RAZ45263.1 DedA family protein [Campylobacter hyointestinalis subsp. lawsonii]